MSEIKRKIRPSVEMSFEEVDPTIITEPGKSSSVLKLYQDYVLGRLDPSQIGNAPSYDPEGSEDIDPYNSFGMTLEDADALRQVQEETIRNERKKQPTKTVANADVAAKQVGQPNEIGQGDADKGAE